MTAAKNLQELERRVALELEYLSYPSRTWTAPRRHAGQPVCDVLIVGGGQSGITIAFRLLRERVTNIRVLDRNPEGREGPWITFARMHTLRTPKNVTGPELGIPSLSARAWYEASFGENSWDKVGKIPRAAWHDYLGWLRRTVGIDVTHNAEVSDIEPVASGLFAVTALVGGTPQTLYARNVVLATGMEGSGRWIVPDMIRDALPRDRYAHTSEMIDFAALAGRRVAVIGAGASAFDNGATALEHGAAAVDLYCRRPQLPAINPNRWIEFAGFLRHFGDLDDATKWRFMKLIFDRNQPPPQDAFERCARFDNFTLRLGSPIKRVTCEGNAIALETPDGAAMADFLIVGTGFGIDLAARPELNRIARHIALWSDRYRPPAGEENPRARRLSLFIGLFPVHREGAWHCAISEKYLLLHLCRHAEPRLHGRYLAIEIRRRSHRLWHYPRAFSRRRRSAPREFARLQRTGARHVRIQGGIAQPGDRR